LGYEAYRVADTEKQTCQTKKRMCVCDEALKTREWKMQEWKMQE